MRKLLNLSLVFLAVILFTNCNEDEAFDLSKLDSKVEAKFESDRQTVFLGTSVQFKNTSVYGKTFEWTFEGGSPATSTEESPLITYSELGEYSVSLKITNEYGENTKATEAYITVTDDAGWDEFEFPNIQFTNKTLNGNGALYKQLIPNEQDFIKRVCLQVCVEMYMTASDINKVNHINYTVDDSETLSAKGGSAPNINISFSSSYLMQKKNEGLSDAELIREIEGVLVHEITHGYQYEPKGAGNYESGTDFYGFIEGMADYVRYVEGFTPVSKRKAGGNWNDGYNASAFFIDWLHSKDFNFLSKFNRSAKAMDPWSWDAAIKEVLGDEASVSALWNEYQSDITSGKITEIDAQLKEKRDKREEVEYNGGSTTTDEYVKLFEKIKFTVESNPEFESPAGEDQPMLIDGDPTTKFLALNTSNTWVKLISSGSSILKRYAFTGADAQPRDPKSWKISGSNDGENWTLIDEKTDQPVLDAGTRTEYEVKTNNAAYSQYKIEMVHFGADQWGYEHVALAEVEFFGEVKDAGETGGETGDGNDTQKVTNAEGISASAEGDAFVEGNEGLDKIFDGDLSSKYLTTVTNPVITFTFPQATVITNYNFITGNDAPERQPKAWTISGSTDGSNWVELDSKTDMPELGNSFASQYPLNNSTAYTHYKYAFENHSGEIFQLGEIQFNIDLDPNINFSVNTDANNVEWKVISSTHAFDKDNEWLAQLSDGDLSTGLASGEGNLILYVTFPQSTQIDNYAFSTHSGDIERQPTSWELQAYDGTNWINIDSRENPDGMPLGATQEFDVSGQNAEYTEFRFKFVNEKDAPWGGKIFTLNEITFNGN